MRIVVIVIALLLMLTGCGEDDPSPTATGSSTSPTASPTSIASPIVGHWERVMTCQERVSALEEAGLGQFVPEHVAGNEMVPGVAYDEPEKIDPAHPCKGAVARRHGHFFTSEGGFGSTDHRDQQVDDGTFRVVGARTIVVEKEFGNVRFRFRVEQGELFLDPVMPDCIDVGCFAAQWAVAVASPGRPWHRVG